MISELLYHRLFYYTNVCDVLLHRINLLNQLELPEKFNYEEVRMEEYSGPSRGAKAPAGTELTPSSPGANSLAAQKQKNEPGDSHSDSSAGEFELVDEKEPRDRDAKTRKEGKKLSRASVGREVKREQALNLKKFKLSSEKIIQSRNVNIVQRRIVQALGQFNDKLNDFLGELLTDEFSAR